MITDSPTTLSQKQSMADILLKTYGVSIPPHIISGMYISQLKTVLITIREANMRGRAEVRME